MGLLQCLFLGLFLGLIAAITTALALWDAKHFTLPNAVTIPMAIGVWVIAWLPQAPFLHPSMLLGGMIWWLLPPLMRLLGGSQMSAAAGDQKLALTLGTVSVMNQPWGLLVAWAVAGMFTIVQFTVLQQSPKKTPSAPLAHGPAMLCGTVCAWVVTRLV